MPPPPTPLPPPLRHAATLPPSAYLLHQTLHPAASLLLIPHSIYTTLSLPPPNSFISLGTRIATLEITEHFLKSGAAPPIALLSPCLAATHPPLLPLRPIRPAKITQVTLTPLFPSADAQNAKYIARLAMRALKGRDAAVGDVIPVTAAVFAVVKSVVGDGVVTADTKIAVMLGKTRGPCISPAVAAAARARWGGKQFWRVRECVAELDACVKNQASIVAVIGNGKDVRDLVKVFGVACDVEVLNGGEKKEKVDVKLSEGGAVVIVFKGVETSIAEMVAKRFGEEGKEKGIAVFLCEERGDLPGCIEGRVEAEVIIADPDEGERMGMLKEFVMDEGDLEELGRMSIGFGRVEVVGLGNVYRDGGMDACKKAVKLFGKGKLSVDVGGVTWEDIGGLEKAKEQILDLVDLDGRVDGIEVNANRRVGVLLYGPPGTGKTLLARAVAGECGCSFISVKGPELLDMYVGESEKHVRDVFEKARAAAPCVVFFDELDALAPSRGRGSDSGGVADRVVSQLLAEFDGVVARNDVFIIAASNRPDLVDAGLLRPGRLDRMVYVSMPMSRKEQAAILKAQTRKVCFSGEVDLLKVVEFAPPAPCLSGADLYALAAAAWMNAAKRVVKKSVEMKNKQENGGINVEDDPIEIGLREAAEWVERGDIYKGWFTSDSKKEEVKVKECKEEEKDPEVMVSEEDLILAAKELKPSLNRRQLQEYEDLRIRIETGG